MGLDLVNSILSIVVIGGVLLFMYGWNKRARVMMFFGSLIILTPLVYFSIGFNPLLVFVPAIALIIADVIMRKTAPA